MMDVISYWLPPGDFVSVRVLGSDKKWTPPGEAMLSYSPLFPAD